MLSKTSNLPVIVTDKDHVIAVSGTSKKELMERRVSSQLEELMESRKPYEYNREEQKKMLPVEGINKTALVASPILSAGDIVGSIMFLAPEEGAALTEVEKKLVTTASMFLGRHMEN